MTATPARLGRRQVDVLRAAAAGTLVRFDDGGWSAAATACTPAARSVAARGLLAEAGRMVEYTFGVAKGRPGTRMGLSADGEQVLQEWELANPEMVSADWRRTEAIRALAGMTGDALAAGVRDFAAGELGVDNGTYGALSQAMRDQPPTT